MYLNLIKTTSALVVTSFMISCSTKNANQNDVPSAENPISQNVLDWKGAYSGIMPCADCDGIATELQLNSDSTYTLTTIYLGKDTTAHTLTGTFKWEGNNIKISGIKEGEGSDKFKVEEHQIKQLDSEGNEIQGAMASNYILVKNGNPEVEDKRWQLTEINGKPVNGSAETHYLIFHSADGKLEAKANCNMLQLNYKIKNQFKLEISDGLSTLMACPDNLEQEFLAALHEADNLTTGDSTLSINKGRMAPLLLFKRVK